MTDPGNGVEMLAWLPPSQRDPGFVSPDRETSYATRIEHAGARAAAWTYEPIAEATVVALRARLRLRINPIVPNMRDFLRDASEHGLAGAAFQRFRRVGLADQLRVALHSLPRARGVLSRDFATGILLMTEIELARFARFAPSCAFLSASVTDLALALDNERLLRGFVRLIQRTYGLRVALATYNYGTLHARLRAWRIRPDVIVAPFNSRGYLMNPSRDACERTVCDSDIGVIASHIEVDGLVDRHEALDYLRRLGIGSAMVDLTV